MQNPFTEIELETIANAMDDYINYDDENLNTESLFGGLSVADRVNSIQNKIDDLLREAIADAKAVRETALANAKIALEEAFTPRLQSMLSKKIATEMEDAEEEDAEERGMSEEELAPQYERFRELQAEYSGLGRIDTVFGFFFGFIRGYIISVCLFSAITIVYNYSKWPINYNESFIFPYVKKGSNYLIEEFPNEKNYEKTKDKIEEL